MTLNKNRKANMIIIYATAVLSLGLLIISPTIAGALAIEDGFIEWLTAIALLIASFFMLWNTRQLWKSRKRVLAVLTAIVAVAFFIFFGEEISWGQRIFDVQTGEFMEEYNWQGETNIHNLHTDIFNVTYYFGALVFLVILPVFAKQAKRLFTKLRAPQLAHFIAPEWVAIPSLVLVGMLDTRFVRFDGKGWVIVSYTLALIIGLAVLAVLIYRKYKERDTRSLAWLNLTLILIAIGYVLALTGRDGVSPNAIAEYKEMVIATGLMSFAYSRVQLGKPTEGTDTAEPAVKA